MKAKNFAVFDHLQIVREAEKSVIKELRDAQCRRASSIEISNCRQRLIKIKQELDLLLKDTSH